MTISQMPAPIAKVAVVGAEPGQGDAAVNPSPIPSASSTSDVAMATTAPAIIAGHDTAEREVSVVPEVARTDSDSRVVAMAFP